MIELSPSVLRNPLTSLPSPQAPVPLPLRGQPSLCMVTLYRS